MPTEAGNDIKNADNNIYSLSNKKKVKSQAYLQ